MREEFGGKFRGFPGACQAYFFGVNVHAVGARWRNTNRKNLTRFALGVFWCSRARFLIAGGPVLVVNRLVFVLIRIVELRRFAGVRIVRGAGGAVFVSSVRILSVMTCQGVRLGVFDSFLCMFYLLA